MIEEIKKIEEMGKKMMSQAKSEAELEQTRLIYLGRKGKLTQILKSLKEMSINEKKEIGPKANKLREELVELWQRRQEAFKKGKREEKIDMTRPGEKVYYGSEHILTQAQQEIIDIFRSMNFGVVEGPEVETEFYNFDALNVPADHPAREMWDTFWLRELKGVKSQKLGSKHKKNRFLMRTHTSPVQIRYMEKKEPPFQIIAPGRVFRYEATDASHEINFHQIEGLMIGREVNLGNLKFIIREFLDSFFKKKLEYRFRPSYFPFTEPSLEVDIRMDKKGKWLEVMGAGMVNPKVLKMVEINPDKWQGFAFGMGVERLTMLKYEIPDIRLFYTGDLRFIKQF